MTLRDSKYPKGNSSLISTQLYICKLAKARQRNRVKPTKTDKKRKREDFRTNCPASISLKLYKKSKVGPFYLFVNLNFNHDHKIICADHLRHRKPLQEVKEKFTGLFESGHSASSALTTHKMDLFREHGPNFYRKCADGAYLPDRYRVYNWYNNVFKEKYGDSRDDDMFHRMTKQADEYNAEQGENCVRVEKFMNEIIVVIITPLMKRHHRITEAGDIMGIDSGRGYDRHNTVIWHLTTKSANVTVPLGLILTNSETAEVLTKALELYKEMLQEDCFGGRGRNLGPLLIIRDGSDVEATAISNVWPLVIQLLCIFHVLQALWRWLFASENGIKLSDRPHILCLFRDIMYDTKSDPEKSIAKMFKDKTVRKYKNYIEHVKLEYLPCIKLWALHHRLNLPIHGMLTNNITESAIKQSKEQVFQRIKSFNIPQTLDFILTRYEQMYEIKLTLIASNRSSGFHKRGYIHDPKKGPDATKVTKIENTMGIFKVPSEFTENKYYVVNLKLGVCQCESGKWGATCKHQNVAAYVAKEQSANVIPVNNPNMRKKIFTLATGNSSVPDGWFSQIKPHSLPEPKIISEGCSPGNCEQPLELEPTVTSAERHDDDDTLKSNQDADDVTVSSTTITQKTPEEEDAELDALIQSFANDLKQSHKNNPDMKKAIRKCIRTYTETLRYPIAKQSALHNFGSEFEVKRKLKGSGHIKNTTKGRNKRTALPVGYKPRGATNRDEVRPDYNLLPKKRPPVKPHKLAKVVKENVSAAKRHSQAPVSMPTADI